MTPKKRFALGCLGGVIPVLVIASRTDFGMIIDHWSTLVTPGAIYGILIRYAILILLGGLAAWLNSQVDTVPALVQLGVAAPAIFSTLITGPAGGPGKQVGTTSYNLSVVGEAFAVERPDEPRQIIQLAVVEKRWGFSNGLFGDFPLLGATAPTFSIINSNTGSCTEAASGPSVTFETLSKSYI